MRILQVSYTDILGQRFNGYDLCLRLSALGHEARQAVWRKDAPGDVSWPLRQVGIWPLTTVSRVLERLLSLQSVLHPSPLQLLRSSLFQQTDLVHLQIIHLDFFNLLFLPWLTRRKPAVWSFHDMWPLTGRCIHPFACDEWLSGCLRCPDLTTPFAMARQGAARMYQIKRRIYASSDFDVIVFSTWLGNRVSRSPLLRGHQIHHVPPGLDTATFAPANGDLSRQRLGIPVDRTVIGFRQSDSIFKGLPAAVDALSSLSDRDDIHILTCGETGRIEALQAHFPVTELGEVQAPEDLADFYRAADIFLMPSTAESFGMMAAEAAACGVPCVVFDGTPLPETCFVNEGGGIAVPQGDTRALAGALRALADDPSLRRRMGRRACELAASRYDFDRHTDAVMRIYESVLAKRRSGPTLSPHL